MLVILVTVILTTVLIQNNEPVWFSFLWAKFYISKLVMMTAVSVIAFILGVLVGRPNRVKHLGGDYDDTGHEKPDTNTLSDDDRNYIN